VELPEALELVHRQVVAGEMQHRIQQHRAVAVRDDEAVAVGPEGIRGVMAKVAVPQHLRDIGHAHGHPRMAGIRLLDRVHCKRANGIREFEA
jgi:hypothetical protein